MAQESLRMAPEGFQNGSTTTKNMTFRNHAVFTTTPNTRLLQTVVFSLQAKATTFRNHCVFTTSQQIFLETVLCSQQLQTEDFYKILCFHNKHKQLLSSAFSFAIVVVVVVVAEVEVEAEVVAVVFFLI